MYFIFKLYKKLNMFFISFLIYKIIGKLLYNIFSISTKNKNL